MEATLRFRSGSGVLPPRPFAISFVFPAVFFSSLLWPGPWLCPFPYRYVSEVYIGMQPSWLKTVSGFVREVAPLWELWPSATLESIQDHIVRGLLLAGC